MRGKQKYKGKEKIFFNALKVILFIVLSFTAIKIGIYGGTFLSEIDSGFVQGVDVNNFKTALGNSFPIINTIYNSGNISTSFSGEVKGFIKSLFDFDLDNPITILNAQSTYMHSYYMNDYQQILALRDKENSIVNNEENNSNKLQAQDENQNGKNQAGLIQDQSSIYMEEDKDQNKPPENNIVSEGKIAIQNETKTKINIDDILKQQLKINLDKKGPKVLIYHTHTTESYIKTLSDLDKKVPTWTDDPRYSVVRVGEELAKILRNKYGIDVIHNGTIHDYPSYNGSYGRSLNTVTKILKSYPSIKVVLDIHRDGLGTDKKLRAVKKINGKNAAQVMFVVGSNGTGLNHPNWKENLKFAVKLQERLNEICPGLVKPIDLSNNRYNQHVTNGALIIEVGGDGNMLSECLESTRYIAEAINDVVNNK